MATMNMSMSWDAILGVRTWTPLQQVTKHSEMVFPGIYKVGENAYLLTQTYNREFERGSPDAPFVTMAVWAGSMDAVKRCVESDATVQIGSLGSSPPDVLLLGTRGEYGELQSQIPKTERRIAERAVYSNTGAFVHKLIEIDRFRFCFLDTKVSKTEKVYAIEVSLL